MTVIYWLCFTRCSGSCRLWWWDPDLNKWVEARFKNQYHVINNLHVCIKAVAIDSVCYCRERNHYRLLLWFVFNSWSAFLGIKWPQTTVMCKYSSWLILILCIQIQCLWNIGASDPTQMINDGTDHREASEPALTGRRPLWWVQFILHVWHVRVSLTTAVISSFILISSTVSVAMV